MLKLKMRLNAKHAKTQNALKLAKTAKKHAKTKKFVKTQCAKTQKHAKTQNALKLKTR